MLRMGGLCTSWGSLSCNYGSNKWHFSRQISCRKSYQGFDFVRTNCLGMGEGRKRFCVRQLEEGLAVDNPTVFVKWLHLDQDGYIYKWQRLLLGYESTGSQLWNRYKNPYSTRSAFRDLQFKQLLSHWSRATLKRSLQMLHDRWDLSQENPSGRNI